MTDAQNRSTERLPAPKVTRKKKRSAWLVWLIPVVAAVIGLSIAWNDWSNKGPAITISFESATGLEQGKTQIRFRDVVVGTVSNIRLNESGNDVLVDVQLNKDAEGLASKGTTFWVVKPTIGLSGVSGLATLLSGVYINADTKNIRGDMPKELDFKGLEQPPPISSDRPGTKFNLRSDTLGSLGPGAPIYFLRIPVGVVTEYHLDVDGKFVDLEVFIDAPYDKYVNGNSRFWDESGIYVNVGADGLTVSTESLVSILAGGLAFGNFGPTMVLTEGHRFTLYDNKVAANAVPIGVSVPITMKFYQETRGLEVQAPVSFQGINIGTITSTKLDFDVYKGQFFTQVEATLYPALLGSVFQTMQRANQTPEQIAESLGLIVKRGLRAELKTVSLITGSLYISLSLKKDVPAPAKIAMTLPFQIPTVESTSLDQIQAQIVSILTNVEKIPFEQLSTDLSSTLSELTAFTKTLENTLTPELSATLNQLQKTLVGVDDILLSSTALPSQIDDSLKEMDRAIRATRSLIDELRAKPNSLIFGESTKPYSRETLGIDP
jgi:paraquat-inducible protein B